MNAIRARVRRGSQSILVKLGIALLLVMAVLGAIVPAPGASALQPMQLTINSYNCPVDYNPWTDSEPFADCRTAPYSWYGSDYTLRDTEDVVLDVFDTLPENPSSYTFTVPFGGDYSIGQDTTSNQQYAQCDTYDAVTGDLLNSEFYSTKFMQFTATPNVHKVCDWFNIWWSNPPPKDPVPTPVGDPNMIKVRSHLCPVGFDPTLPYSDPVATCTLDYNNTLVFVAWNEAGEQITLGQARPDNGYTATLYDITPGVIELEQYMFVDWAIQFSTCYRLIDAQSAIETISADGSTTTFSMQPGDIVNCDWYLSNTVEGLIVNKTADVEYATAGDTVTYSIEVTNSLPIGVKDIQLVDPLPGLQWTNGSFIPLLGPGESATLTATYQVTANDPVGEYLHNSVQVDGEGTAVCSDCAMATGSDYADVFIVDGSETPAIEITKDADVTTAQPGDVITYTFGVQNTGNVPLSEVTIDDPTIGFSHTFPAGTFDAPLDYAEVTAQYTVTEADAEAGSILNVATVTGQVPPTCACEAVSDTDDATVTVTVIPAPAIEIVKTADKVEAVIGDVITYTFEVTNSGNVPLSEVTIDDPIIGFTHTFPAGTFDLPGAVASVSHTYTVSQADVDAGEIHNIATVTGQPPANCETCQPVTATDSVDILISQNPVIEIVKTADVATAQLGDTITYTFDVTNLGDTTLNDVEVSDPMVGLQFVESTQLGSLAPGETITITATYVVTQANVDAQQVVNSASVTSFASNCTLPCAPIVDSDMETVPVPPPPTPRIEIVKTADVPTAQVGDTITYTFEVTNTGEVVLDTVLIEDLLPGLQWVTPPGISDLAVGQKVTRTATYVVTQADVDAGSVMNVATVSGTPDDCPDCPEVSDSDDASVAVMESPEISISIDKSADVSQANAGDTITYTFVVTNTGDVSFNDVNIADPMAGLEWQAGPAMGAFAPGDVKTAFATYVVTQADVDAGFVQNIATVTGVPMDCPDCPDATDQDDAEVLAEVAPEPGIEIIKEADVETAHIGDTITYTFTVENTGTETLNNVVITDPLPGLNWIVGPNLGFMTPGQVKVASATHVVDAVDEGNGVIHNVAVVTGAVDDCPTCPPEQDDDFEDVTIPEVPPTVTPDPLVPSIEIIKEADVEVAHLGDTVTYTFTVTNTGDVALTDVLITDALPGLDWITGPFLGSLAIGETKVGVATHVVDAVDEGNGAIHNVAIANGVPDPICVGCQIPEDSDFEDVVIEEVPPTPTETATPTATPETPTPTATPETPTATATPETPTPTATPETPTPTATPETPTPTETPETPTPTETPVTPVVTETPPPTETPVTPVVTETPPVTETATAEPCTVPMSSGSGVLALQDVPATPIADEVIPESTIDPAAEATMAPGCPSPTPVTPDKPDFPVITDLPNTGNGAVDDRSSFDWLIGTVVAGAAGFLLLGSAATRKKLRGRMDR